MAKTKTVYVCSNCGADSPKWLGKCPNCGEWNTYVEEIVTKEPAVKRPVPGIMEGNKIRPVLLRDITTEEEARIDLKDDELNRVLGGGLVKGSLVLIGGEPGIGKSTLVGLDRLENPICLGRGEQSPVETPGGPIIA